MCIRDSVPIKFIGTGEKLDAIDLFYPDRMADRILGMGDVVSLVEKVQDVYDEKDTMKTFEKMQKGTFGLDDMLAQMHQMRKLGPLSGIMKMIPGMPKMPEINDEDTDPVSYTHLQLIEKIWGMDYDGFDRTVDVHIKRIRENLGHLPGFKVVTVRGLGYKIEVEA